MDWIRPTDELPPEREYVLVMLLDESTPNRKPGISGPHVGWLRVHSDGPFFVVPARNGRDWGQRRGLVLVWREMDYDARTARTAAATAIVADAGML